MDGLGRARSRYRLAIVSETPDPAPTSDDLTDQPDLPAESGRRAAKIARLREQGVEPYPYRYDRSHTLTEVRAAHGALEPGTETEIRVQVPDA
jgi:lysyl-tRNA synthetase class 2